MSAIGASPRIAYRPRRSPLHAAGAPFAAAYGLALAAAALISPDPLLLATLLLCVLGAGAAAGIGRDLWRAARATALPIVLLTVAVNLLVSRGGLTVFARLGDWGVLGQVDLTVESLVYGLVFALRLLVVMLACLLVVLAADPDQLLLACRRVSPHSALSAALATRMLAILGEDARRLSEAQRCRPDGGARGLAGRLAVLRATVSGALERSLDVAAVLEMRGYGSARLARRTHGVRSRHDVACAAAALGVLVLAVLGAVTSAAQFSAYPLVHLTVGPLALVLCALLALVAGLPFLDRRGIER